MTICPKIVQFRYVSVTTSPVTHVADVAVNSELNQFPCPDLFAMGSDSKSDPASMINAKPDAISLVVDFLAVIFFFLNSNPIPFDSFFLDFPDKTISYYITFAKENKLQITNILIEKVS